MFFAYRSARVPVLAAALALSGILLLTASHIHQSRTSSHIQTAQANSHWQWCNSYALRNTPPVLWSRIESATQAHKDVPGSFWSDGTYRDDIAKIVCYESTFEYHATNPSGFYGWFQMNQPLIASEGVTWNEYWGGSGTEHPGWYQCTAGERYIHGRYRNPAVAWLHEEDYGWY